MEKVLSIAGFDPTGGAGIIADIKVFSRLGLYGLAVPTASTNQKVDEPIEVKPEPVAFFCRNLKNIFSNFNIQAVKIGMLARPEIVKATADILRKYKPKYIVLDPVLKSSGEIRFLNQAGIQALKFELLSLATIITPNIPEAGELVGRKIRNYNDAKDAATELNRNFGTIVVVKGGHLPTTPTDIFYNGTELIEMKGEKFLGSPHGTGCVFSSALTVYLAKGLLPREAVSEAKRFTAELIKAAKGEKLLPI